MGTTSVVADLQSLWQIDALMGQRTEGRTHVMRTRIINILTVWAGFHHSWTYLESDVGSVSEDAVAMSTVYEEDRIREGQFRQLRRGDCHDMSLIRS
jgi:hypothetical protein